MVIEPYIHISEGTGSHHPLAPISWVLVRGTEAAERGYIFWRISERPILQKPHGFATAPKSLFPVTSLPAGRQMCLCGEGKQSHLLFDNIQDLLAMGGRYA